MLDIPSDYLDRHELICDLRDMADRVETLGIKSAKVDSHSLVSLISEYDNALNRAAKLEERIAKLEDALHKITALPESCTPKFDDSARIAALVEAADIAWKALDGS